MESRKDAEQEFKETTLVSTPVSLNVGAARAPNVLTSSVPMSVMDLPLLCYNFCQASGSTDRRCVDKASLACSVDAYVLQASALKRQWRV